MLARRLPGILTPMSFEVAIQEAPKIQSSSPLVVTRAIRFQEGLPPV